jgi:hypothetical protein
MGKRPDTEKLLAWRQRLIKLRTSGLSLAAFCRQEEITAASFYYWSRRVREAEGTVDVTRSDTHRRVGRQASESGSQVEVAIGEYVRIRLPGNDLELIGAVLASLQTSVVAGKAEGAFKRIELTHAATSLR